MDREPYFKELCIALAREGFTLQSEQDGLLPVNWNNLPLCRVTDAGGLCVTVLCYSLDPASSQPDK